jgi:hypothetical protein
MRVIHARAAPGPAEARAARHRFRRRITFLAAEEAEAAETDQNAEHAKHAESLLTNLCALSGLCV